MMRNRFEIDLDPDVLSSILRTTCASAIAGLLAADPTFKSRAADFLARDIVTRLKPPVESDRNQLQLPL